MQWVKDQAKGGDALGRRQTALRGQQTVSLGEQGSVFIVERVRSLPEVSPDRTRLPLTVLECRTRGWVCLVTTTRDQDLA